MMQFYIECTLINYFCACMFSALNIHIFFGVREVSYTGNSIQLFFQGLLFEAKVYSYINNIPTTCFSKGKRAVNCRLQRKKCIMQ